MAVVYRCDACNKLVEDDKDIVKIKFSMFRMREGVPDPFADWAVGRIMCTDCKNKILNFGKIELKEES